MARFAIAAYKDFLLMHTTPARVYRSQREAIGTTLRDLRARPFVARPINNELRVLDLFAGAGGFSSGLTRVISDLRRSGHSIELHLSMLNHWEIAMETARTNLGSVNIINASIENIDPLEAVPEGYLDLLLASPECIYHSSARGNRPINDQRRSTAGEVRKFLTDLDVRALILENVVEFRNWGPLDEKNRPIPERRGEFFDAFVRAIRKLHYTVDYRPVVASVYGDPTSRKRLFLQALRDRHVVWPKVTHSENGHLPGTKPLVTARDILDFNNKGQDIYDRVDPHVPKTLRRIIIGLRDQIAKAPLAAAYITANERYMRVSEEFHNQMKLKPTEGRLKRKLTRAERAQCQAITQRARLEKKIATEAIFQEPVGVFTIDELRGALDASLVGEDHCAMTSLSPVITKLYGTGTTSDINAPLDTVTAGGINFGLAEPTNQPVQPVLLTVNHGATDDHERRSPALDEPLPTLTSKGSVGIADPFILRANASDTSSWDDAITPIDEPLRTVTTKNNLSLIRPDAVLLPQHNFGKETVGSLDEPLPAITTIARHGIAEPSIEPPAPAADPAPVEPFLLPQQRWGADTDSIARPLRTITVKNGTGIVQTTVDTTALRPGRPWIVIVGLGVFELGIAYRMLTPDELARAMSFITKDHTYKFIGSRQLQTHQIGNAVAVETAKAIIGTTLAQYLHEERTCVA